jgi:hypothetical protein
MYLWMYVCVYVYNWKRERIIAIMKSGYHSNELSRVNTLCESKLRM